jgi:hypothetical protein
MNDQLDPGTIETLKGYCAIWMPIQPARPFWRCNGDGMRRWRVEGKRLLEKRKARHERYVKLGQKRKQTPAQMAAEERRIFQAFIKRRGAITKRQGGLWNSSLNQICDQLSKQLAKPNSIRHIKAVLKRCEVTSENWDKVPPDWLDQRLTGR